jgi:putative flippase GtrA
MGRLETSTQELSLKNYVKTFVHREALGQMFRLGLIGGFNTVFTLSLSVLFRDVFSMRDEWAVTAAWVVGTLVSYALNRTWTFSLDTEGANARETLHFFGVNVVAGVLTVAIVWLARRIFGALSNLEFILAQLVAAGIIVIPKFAAYRDVVFRRSLEDAREAKEGE